MRSLVGSYFSLTIVLLFTTNYLLLQAQDVSRARGVVETLSLPFFGGRGYVGAGDSLAAEFVAKEFGLAGLKPLQATYFQPFEFSVNTFPGKVELKISGKKKVAGKELILDPASSGVAGKFKLLRLDSSIFSNPSFKFPVEKKKIALVYPSEWEKRVSKLSPDLKFEIEKFPVIIKIVAKKLTYSVSQQVEKQSTVEILASSFPSKAKNIKLEIENKFIPQHIARNVLGYLEGTTKKDSFLVVSAHYDHLGRMGKDTYFPGANDNASGIAMMLEMARFYFIHWFCRGRSGFVG